MIRTILYRLGGQVEFQEGVLHGFTADGCAIVEDMVTGELGLVPLKAGSVKFKVITTDWVEAQMRAQQEAQRQQVMAVPNVNFQRGR